MNKVLLVLAGLVGASAALVRTYDVGPRTAGWSVSGASAAQLVAANFTSVERVQLYVSPEQTAGAAIELAVYEYPGGTAPVAVGRAERSAARRGWVEFMVSAVPGRALVRGAVYEFRFSTADRSAMRFWYDAADPYSGGFMLGDGDGLNPLADLCMRIDGRLKPVAPDWWSIVPGCPWGSDSALLPTWLERMREMRARRADLAIYWNQVEPERGAPDFGRGGHDRRSTYLHDSLGCVLEARPQLCPQWASSRDEGAPEGGGTRYWSSKCPPLNLFLPVDHPDNYWARFVEQTIRHHDAAGDTIHSWEIWNEPNDTTIDFGPFDGWWRRPTRGYPGLGEGARPLCSLYIRLCAVSESVIHHSGLRGHEADRVLIGSVSNVLLEYLNIVPGDTWLWMCYDIARDNVFWDGVAVHPYSAQHFDVDFFEAEARRSREVMGQHHQQVWNSEVGWRWDFAGRVWQANWLAQAFAAAAGSALDAEGGYEGLMFYALRSRDSFGFVENDWQMTPRPAFHALCHSVQVLTGLSPAARSLLEVPGTGGSLCLYEFADDTSDRRTWLAWTDWRVGQTAVRLPIRTGTAEACLIDHGPGRIALDPAPDAAGWLSVPAGVRPTVIREPAAAELSRCRLVVDSVVALPGNPRPGELLELVAHVRNADTRTATPGPVNVEFRIDDSIVGRARSTEVIAPGSGAAVAVSVLEVPEWLRGVRLLSAAANPDRDYVEADGYDDNAAHRVVTVDGPPAGAPGRARTAGDDPGAGTLVLAPPRPNPFRSTFGVDYSVPRRERVVVRLFDASGRVRGTLYDGIQGPGRYQSSWDGGAGIRAGVYFVQVETPQGRVRRRVAKVD